MPHDWTTAPDNEWRGYVADALTALQRQLENLDSKFDGFCENCNIKHTALESRMVKVETRSGIVALIATALTNVAMWFGMRQ